jgi:stress-induced morphogen
MVEPHVLEERIRQQIPDVEILRIEDLTGTKDHYRAVIVTTFFEGKTRVEQHQAVYRALGELMSGPVHALALSTHTPVSWAKAGGQDRLR